MRSLSDKTALLIVANLCKYAVGFILPLVFARLMSQDEYGTYLQLTLLANVASGILVLGLPMSVYYFYHRSNRPTLIAQTQIILLASGAVSALLILAAAPELAARMHNPQLRALLPMFSLYVGLLVAGEHFMHVMISQNRYLLAVGLEFVETVLRVVALTVLLLSGYGLPAVVAALVVYAALRLAGRSAWLWTGRDSVRQASWNAKFPAAQLAYSLPLAASICIGLIGKLLDKAIVAVSFSPIAYAIYSVGALEVPLDSIFQASVANVLRATLPALVEEGRIGEVVRIWRDSVRKLALIMLPSFVFLWFFAQRLITALFTRRYEASVHVFHIYLLVIPLYMFVVSVVPQVFGKTHLNFYVVGAAVASNLALSFVLLRVIGILGPAVAFTCSAYLTSTLYFVVTARLLKVKAATLMPTWAIVRTLFAACIALLPAAAVAAYRQGLAPVAAAGLVFAMFYFAAGYLVGAFRPSDIETMRSWMRRLAPAGAA
ncbi:MAG TPA: oligosaccharide flippase family protein [Steroidobacteraceae bacterium]